MPYVVESLGVRWRPLRFASLFPEQCAQAQARLDAELRSWVGTPYLIGQQCRGAGVDCVRFVGAILDFMGGTRTALEMLPPDAAFHAPELARRALHRFRWLFRPMERVTDGWVEPGDVVVIGPRRGGPGHGLVVGCRDGTMYEAGSRSVNQVGFGLPASHRLEGVFRKGDRERWAAEQGAR